MKNISKFILTLSVLFAFYACNDAIEIDQPGNTTVEAINTVERLELALLGVYLEMDVTQEIALSAYFTDETYFGPSNGGQGTGLYAFNLNAASAAGHAMWLRHLRLINRANKIIDASVNVNIATGEQTQFNEIMGQLYAMRAFGHFQMQSYFTTDYTNPNALGAIALNYDPSVEETLLRDTNAEVFGLIESDLALAESLLSTQSNPTFISRDFVLAVRARMAAYRQNYPIAMATAQDLLSRYPLATPQQYRQMFLDESDAEIIFKLRRVVGDRYDRQADELEPQGEVPPGTGGAGTGSVWAGGWAGANFAFVNPHMNGGPYMKMAFSLFQLFDQDDIRWEVNISNTSVIDNNNPLANRAIIAKYPGRVGSQPLLNDLKVFRSSEMLLIIAEAMAAQGDINGAANSTAALLQTLRSIRLQSSTAQLPVYANQAEAFADILRERRIELAFEGHRYKDLKRMGVRAGVGIDRNQQECQARGGDCTLAPTDYRFTLPIPVRELNANPGIRAQQNPGYN